MPEGPEIKVFSEYLFDRIIGRNLVNVVSISKKKLNWTPSVVRNVCCKGKLLWIEFDDVILHVILLISGWITDEKNEIEKETLKYILVFENKYYIYVTDPRKLCKITRISYQEHDQIIHNLGIDILTKNFTFDSFLNLVDSFSINICAFLMDQSILTGIGNYIKNEVLYLAKINPRRRTNTLVMDEIRDLFNCIRFVAFSNLIEELEDYNLRIPKEISKIGPRNLEIPYKFKVYKRQIDNYDNEIIEENIAGRNTYYVPSIQK